MDAPFDFERARHDRHVSKYGSTSKSPVHGPENKLRVKLFNPLATADRACGFAAEGVAMMRITPASPNLNARAERWVQTVKRELLDRFMVFGEKGDALEWH